MNLYVGTSGFSYQAWKGTFYPADLPGKRMLRYYAEQFRTVEINNTFYRMPKKPLLDAWAAEVPADFRFVLKAPRQITHILKLKDAAGPVSYFLETAGSLQERMGPLLFQIPPYLRKDAPRLRGFLSLISGQKRLALEFRHASWFDDEVFELLHEHGAALCMAEADGGLEVPRRATTDWGYLRLRRQDYSDADLKAWVKWLQAQAWQDAFVFFKHEDEARGPQHAKRFLELAAE